MLKELLTLNIFGFFLIFARVGAAIMVMPGFSTPYVNVRARLAIALAISFVLSPILAQQLPGLPATAGGLGVLLAGEAIIGAFMGTVALILMGSLQTAGTIIAYVSSMANAFIQDPIAQQQSSLVSGFLSTLGILLVFITDMHHLMLSALMDSYTLFVPGQALAFGDIAEVIGRQVMDSFALGVQLSSPLIITGFVYYLGLGLLSRLMPAMQVFFIGLPIQIAIQISVFALTLSSIMLVFLSRFEEGYEVFLAP
jgi:flagellar biosynthetic protein FliR